MTKPTPVPPWAHAVENIGGTWRCSAVRQTGLGRGEFSRCSFTSTDLQEAVAHTSQNQYDALHEKPVDMRAA